MIYYKGLSVALVFSILFLLAMLLALNPSALMINGDFIVTQFLQSIYLAQTIFAVFSAVFWGREFLKSSLRTSLLSTPSRVKFFLYQGNRNFVIDFMLFLHSYWSGDWISIILF